MIDGRRALLFVLQRTKARFVAARVRVSPSCVSEWAAGRKRPSSRARELLEANYGIRHDSWPSTVYFAHRAS